VKEEKPATLNSSDELPVFSHLKEAEVAAKNCRVVPFGSEQPKRFSGPGLRKPASFWLVNNRVTLRIELVCHLSDRLAEYWIARSKRRRSAGISVM
jgi:hypothetical protein